MPEITALVEQLNHAEPLTRLSALADILDLTEKPTPVPEYVNNHVHTIFSFSPYSPTKAVYMAAMAGLPTVGIMDHDSISGAREFIAAGKIAGLATTIGVETRCLTNDTPLYGKRINNPDQDSIAYCAIHGIPHRHIETTAAFFAPYQAARLQRDRAMAERINDITAPHGVYFDFDRDVLPLSQAANGGTVTERHLLYALSLKLLSRFESDELISFIQDKLTIVLNDKQKAMLIDVKNQYKAYDLLGILKGYMVSQFYINAHDECPHISQLTAFAKSIGAIPVYPYLGDITADITGDKKAQTFEDGYLDELMQAIKDLGFEAVAYMPTRNTKEQLLRLQNLCKQYGFMQISGEDINTPRQSFICEAYKQPEFRHLVDATWRLIEHERLG